MFCDDGMGDGQTESASIGFCREIRIEDVGEAVFRYADSSVGYGDLDVFSAWKRQVVLRAECAGLSAAPDLSAQEHRVMGVEDQLVQGLCHLSMVNVDPLKRRGERNVARQLGASRGKLGGFSDEPVPSMAFLMGRLPSRTSAAAGLWSLRKESRSPPL